MRHIPKNNAGRKVNSKSRQKAEVKVKVQLFAEYFTILISLLFCKIVIHFIRKVAKSGDGKAKLQLFAEFCWILRFTQQGLKKKKVAKWPEVKVESVN